MPNLLCSTACGAASALPTNYFNCTTKSRKYAYKHFVLLKCDYQFTDILDAAEWTAAVVSGDVVISPPGVLTLPTPDQTIIDIDCDTKLTTDITYTIDFFTYQVSEGDTTDCDFFKVLYDDHTSYVLMWYDCVAGDERWAVQDDWRTAIDAGAPATVSGTSPGFDFSVTQVPTWQAGDGDRGQWATQFQMEVDGMICQSLIPGAAAAVEA